ncbi:protein SLX4IP isoform X2 [Lacerta agilis]|uniref:protein SLX4IP isoform X2 n=1 Tax=Lacerta agilis TaxID=80427 RepID=UPI00141A6035|nr:protein SLX4IP isoform X2 [Lacerta agilis]
MLHKLVIKCGNFAVLVDFHVTSRDSSKDTVWFSDRKREGVCLLLKDVVDSRVTQYLKGRKRHGQSKETEHAKVNPLSLKELRVFPDRFVVCVTRLDSNPPPQEETLPPGTSEYFGEPAATSLTQQEKQDALKKIVKRTKTKKADESKQPSKDTVKVYLGSLHSDRE